MTYDAPELYTYQYGTDHIMCFCCDKVELEGIDKGDQWPTCLRCSLECLNYTSCASSRNDNAKEKRNNQ